MYGGGVEALDTGGLVSSSGVRSDVIRIGVRGGVSYDLVVVFTCS